jgi:transposase
MTYRVKDLEQRYGVTEHTIIHWIRTGQLSAINVGVDPGKKKPRYRITQQAIEQFELARSTIPPLPRTGRHKRHPKVIEFYK